MILIFSWYEDSRVLEGTSADGPPPDPFQLEQDTDRLSLLLTELRRLPSDQHERVISSGFRDLLLADNFLYLMKKADRTEMDFETRQLYKKLTDKAILLIAEVGALVNFNIKYKELQLI